MEPHTLRFKVALDPTYTEYDASANTDDGKLRDVGFDVRCAFDGRLHYAVVEIGDQCWFAENLRYDGVCG